MATFNFGKYTEAKDKKKDAKMTKGMTPAQKAKFEKADKAHGAKKKPKTMAEDKKIDAKIIRRLKRSNTLRAPKGALCFILIVNPCGIQSFTPCVVPCEI